MSLPPATVNLLTRQAYELCTDPQRRCYYGTFKSSELAWLPWEILEYQIPASRATDRIAFWTELNDYAVSQRGKFAKREFKIDATLQPCHQNEPRP
jgi:hypothetical protein